MASDKKSQAMDMISKSPACKIVEMTLREDRCIEIDQTIRFDHIELSAVTLPIYGRR